MQRLPLLAIILASTLGAAAANDSQLSATPTFDLNAAQRFTGLALACVHKEFPNKISHVLNSDTDVAAPRKLTPAFYGCYDWHSSVHGHWLLARLARTFPNAPFASAAKEALRQSLTPENIAQEVVYLKGEGRSTFERPYGLAWLMQLGQELREWNDPLAKELSRNLVPLEEAAKDRLTIWLPKLSNPIRIGEHNQTAFAFGLLIDYARGTKDQPFLDLLTRKAREFYLNDKNCPLAYEPSGEDFLSPCIAEADAMRRVLPQAEFAKWLQEFLPEIPIASTVGWRIPATQPQSHSALQLPGAPKSRIENGANPWLPPVVSPDPSDPKLAHLDGLNLSRAWMLEGIASVLPLKDPRLPALRSAVDAHLRAGLAAVTGAHYEGGHWLGSFAVYLVTKRGISSGQ
jgi:Protein of unknown function (DUF2891)